MKKLIVLAAVLPLAILGCDDKKKAAKSTAATPELTQPAPVPYVPPTGTSPMADSSGTGTVITPLTPTDLNPPAPSQDSGMAKTGPKTGHTHPKAAHSESMTPDSGSSMSSGTSGSSSKSMKAGTTYVVKSGDSLSKIAAKVYGKGNVKKGVAAIMKANGLKTDVIRVGQKIKIPSM